MRRAVTESVAAVSTQRLSVAGVLVPEVEVRFLAPQPHFRTRTWLRVPLPERQDRRISLAGWLHGCESHLVAVLGDLENAVLIPARCRVTTAVGSKSDLVFSCR